MTTVTSPNDHATWVFIRETESELKELTDNWTERTLYLLNRLKSEMGSRCNDLQVWYLIEDTWVESEKNHLNRDLWREIFSLRKVPSHFAKTDIPPFFTLPDELVVFRGGDPSGFSWSMSNKKGRWFAERYGQNRKFWGLHIRKSDVLFYTNKREEQEVVVIPQEHHEPYEIGYSPRSHRYFPRES